MSFSIPAARDSAQQIVTLLMHGDRHEALDVAMEFDDHLVLAGQPTPRSGPDA